MTAVQKNRDILGVIVSHSLRFRDDIEWVLYSESEKWVARDPLNSSFFYFSQLEFSAAKLLNGKNSLLDVVNAINQLHLGPPISEQWLRVLIGKWSGSHLLLPTTERRSINASRTWPARATRAMTQLVLSPLSIRVPILKPSEFSLWFRNLAFVLFHPFVVTLTLVVSIACVIFVLNQLLQTPNWIVFDLRKIQGDRWIAILISYLVVKTLHELGHVLACVRWGARCREIGVLFLFFTPCLYCDTTDCWKLPSKWQRAAISSAGLYVEVILACIASIVWLTAYDGLERTVAASVMLMCSLGTIFVNGNPFFRYDGYYILSDLWGVPNLAQQSSSALWRIFIFCLGGRKWRSDEFDRSIFALAGFALVSTLYRLTVLILVMWLVWNTLVPLGMGLFALLIFATTGLGILVAVSRFLHSLMTEFFAPMPIRFVRFAFLIAILVAGLYLVSVQRVSGHVRARGYLDFGDKVPIYAAQAGSIKFVSDKMASSDLHFEKGDRMFEIDCPEKELERINLRNEIFYTKSRIEILKKSSVNERSTSYELPPLLEMAKDLEAKRVLLAPEIELLTQSAPKDGFFVPSAARVALSLTAPIDVRLLTSPIHPNSLNCTVEKGTQLGWFTPKNEVVFQSLISESDIKSLQIDSAATCILDSSTGLTHPCKIIRISPDPIEAMPSELLGDSYVITQRNEKGMFVPDSPYYQVTVRPVRPISSHIKGSRATIHFQLAPRTVLQHIVRYVQLTFKPLR